MPQTRSAKHCPRPRRAGPPCRRQQPLCPDTSPPWGRPPSQAVPAATASARKTGGDRGELERIRSAFGQRQAPCGRRFSAFRKGRQHCLPAKRQSHRAPALQKGGVFPPPRPRRAAPARPQGTEKGGREPCRSSPAFCPPLSGAARPLSRPRPGHKIMTKVPAVISTPPRAVFRVIFSCKKTKASTMVMTTLNLSMGTTRETSPIWMAL